MADTLEILWQSNDLVAVMKPAGLATIPGRGETDSVLEMLGRQLGLPVRGDADPRLRIVHRLDKETSGVLLLAKNITAQRHLSHQFQNNSISKEYLALVYGRPLQETGEVDAPLAPDVRTSKRMAISKHGRPARTAWKAEESFRQFTLVRCFPKTGKTHQIRVHLKHAGMPLAVDPLYNPPVRGTTPGISLSQFKRGYRPAAGQEERPLIARLTLHAERLTFQNLDSQPVTIQAALPKDFRAVLNMLRKYGR